MKTAGTAPAVVEAALPAPSAAADGADARTRDRVAQLLLELGPSTAAELGARLGLSPAGIRRHLDAMCATGAISECAPRGSARIRRGRGRPAKHYALTEAGHAAGPTSYDDLAGNALDFLAEYAGEAAVEEFARRRAEQLAERVSARMDPAEDADAAELAGALTAEGYAATVHPVATGTQICQHHCPIQSVAAQFPQLCDAETAALSRLLDTHVQRLATIAHGDGVCTTYVPRVAPAEDSSASSSNPPANSHRKVSP